MKINMIKGLLMVTCFVGAMACSQQENSENTEAALEPKESITLPNIDEDVEFAQHIAERNLLSIQLGELAQTKASSKGIKKLANDMVETHRNANIELRKWASARAILLPDELGKNNQTIYDELAKREGDDFDEAYSDYLVTEHKQDLRQLERESEKGKDNELKSWAAEKIPVWQNHLDKAKEAENTADKKDE